METLKEYQIKAELQTGDQQQIKTYVSTPEYVDGILYIPLGSTQIALDDFAVRQILSLVS